MQNVKPKVRREVNRMKVSFSRKGTFEPTISWLKRQTRAVPKDILAQIGDLGIESLSENTPKDTGETAMGWGYKVKSGNNPEIVFFNNAHPNEKVNIAKIIELGHGTRTGGVVYARPYIKRSMTPVFEQAKEILAREALK